MREVVLGIDIGTSSSKGVLVDFGGKIHATAVRNHEVSRPAPGHVEMDAAIWWQEFIEISRELTATEDVQVVGVGVSGMGPCVLIADEDARALRPAILYGIDTRAVEQIDCINAAFGQQSIVDRCGSALSTQAVGPKLAWLADHEPGVASRARMLFMPSSWLAYQLTGEYVLDHHSASQCTPMYDTSTHEWYPPYADPLIQSIELPLLVWPGDIIGHVNLVASDRTGIPRGVPVIGGTIDAWSEAVSVGAHRPGDLMLMYGTTMFLVNTLQARTTSSSLWGTVGVVPGTYNLAGGMATSGAITAWLRTIVGSPDFSTLLSEADKSGPGANGLLMLPYFAGERTPVADPNARGLVAGLTLDHTRGDLYRATLEATAFGVRHNVDALTNMGGDVRRTIAVGGGTQGGLWTQIVSDVTGLEQQIPSVTIGASFGAAYLAAEALGSAVIGDWNPIVSVTQPRQDSSARYERLYGLYRELYESTASVTHQLVDLASTLSRNPTT
ncbi:xylulokinase [Arthrobacter sp. V4I6]|uniref:FGGY-family carbohydrate kinase n=1 Tax=unclassified Arthrobacter TaxID=235627 RepID=UPI0027813860|nr:MULTISPECIES: FGGY family carbohydrate kinase [unclassified Arthrobacter]MDQ0820653.1 xylulokinase [Arthrobacter sp. V1I7]MDQ0854912.1 xylulokinase [Arthrobacter sp. V4I6]